MHRRHVSLMLAVGLVAGWALTGVAPADDLNVVGSDLTIATNEVQRGDIIVIDGDLKVEGQVKGSIAVLGGNVTLTRDSEVRGDIATIGGKLDVQGGARIVGDTVTLTNDVLAELLGGVFAGGDVDDVVGRFLSANSGAVVRIGEPLSVPVSDRVSGDVIVIGADADVQGKVRGATIVIGGALTIGPGADVADDAAAIGGPIEVDPTASVRGARIALQNPWIVNTARDKIARRGMAAEPAEAEPATPALPAEPAPPAPPARVIPGLSRISGDLVVGPDERVDGGVSLLSGDLKIQGRVNGDVSVTAGSVDVCDNGEVYGNVSVAAGNLVISGSGRVRGDCAVLGELSVKDSGRLEGNASAPTIRTEGSGTITGNRSDVGTGRPMIGRVAVTPRHEAHAEHDERAGIVALIILGGGLMLLCLAFFGRRATIVEAMARAGRKQCFWWGLLGVALVAPISTLLVALVVTIPVAIVYWIWLAALSILGFSAMCLLLGGWATRKLKVKTESLAARAGVGLAVLVVCMLLGALPVINVLVAIFLVAVGLIGFGAAMITNFGTQAGPTKPWPLSRFGRNANGSASSAPAPSVTEVDLWATPEDAFDVVPRSTTGTDDAEDSPIPVPEKPEPDDEDDLTEPSPPPPAQ